MANNFFYLLVIIFLVFVGVLIFAVTRKRDSQESSTSATPKKRNWLRDAIWEHTSGDFLVYKTCLLLCMVG